MSDELDDLKRLAGILPSGTVVDDGFGDLTGNDKARIMREQNIKPGTDAWFKLWFARPGLTKEKNV